MSTQQPPSSDKQSIANAPRQDVASPTAPPPQPTTYTGDSSFLRKLTMRAADCRCGTVVILLPLRKQIHRTWLVHLPRTYLGCIRPVSPALRNSICLRRRPPLRPWCLDVDDPHPTDPNATPSPAAKPRSHSAAGALRHVTRASSSLLTSAGARPAATPLAVGEPTPLMAPPSASTSGSVRKVAMPPPRPAARATSHTAAQAGHAALGGQPEGQDAAELRGHGLDGLRWGAHRHGQRAWG